MKGELAEKLDPRHTAFVIVDVQNDFCHPDGAFARVGMDMSAIQRAARQLPPAIDLAHQAGVPVIFIQTTHSAWTDDDAWGERHRGVEGGEKMLNCREGTWGAEFYHVAPGPLDRVVIKHRYSAFLYTDLELILRCRGIRTLALAGVTTDTCVHTTTRDGYMRGFHAVVLEDCCGATGTRQHEWALKDLTNKVATVVPSKLLGEIWVPHTGS